MIAADAEYNVDELARAGDTMTTTVRMYQARGLLPAPAKRGRVAIYGERHLARLRLIAELQRRGHSLAGIKELLDNADRGTALPELLGLRSWSQSAAVRMEVTDVIERFGGNVIEAADMQRAVRLGLMQLDGSALIVDERFIQVGADLAALGVPVEAILDEWESLLRRTDAIALRFSAVFETHLWPALDDRSAPLAEISDVLDRLAPLAQQVTALALETGLRRAADRFVAEHMPGADPPS
jgi:DNA-binding transcriptional MerR regulator